MSRAMRVESFDRMAVCFRVCVCVCRRVMLLSAPPLKAVLETDLIVLD